jgi:hypothetical protein
MDLCTVDRCKNIEKMVKNLSNTQLEELFKIVQKNNCKYTLNNNGVFLNLSWIDDRILREIELFISFCEKSKNELDRYEQLCRDLNENLETTRNEHLEECCTEGGDASNRENAVYKKLTPKMSSTMKFYLLKKRYSKTTQTNTLSNVNYNELCKDTPLLKN